MFQAIRIWFACWFAGHDWTCKAAEDIPPTESQLKHGVSGFYDYAKMYCKRCGRESGRNL
jgi:hypothetical protein